MKKFLILLAFVLPVSMTYFTPAYSDSLEVPQLKDFVGLYPDELLNEEYSFFYAYYYKAGFNPRVSTLMDSIFEDEKAFENPNLTNLLAIYDSLDAVSSRSNAFPEVEEVNAVIIGQSYYCEEDGKDCIVTSFLAYDSKTQAMHGCVLGEAPNTAIPDETKPFSHRYYFSFTDQEVSITVEAIDGSQLLSCGDASEPVEKLLEKLNQDKPK